MDSQWRRSPGHGFPVAKVTWPWIPSGEGHLAVALQWRRSPGGVLGSAERVGTSPTKRDPSGNVPLPYILDIVPGRILAALKTVKAFCDFQWRRSPGHGFPVAKVTWRWRYSGGGHLAVALRPPPTCENRKTLDFHHLVSGESHRFYWLPRFRRSGVALPPDPPGFGKRNPRYCLQYRDAWGRPRKWDSWPENREQGFLSDSPLD